MPCRPARPSFLVLLAALAAPGIVRAQAQGAWSACRMDSLSTYNCASYYSGTVSLTSDLRGTNLRQTLRITARVTAGRVQCSVSGSEAGEFEGPGMLAVEHSSNMNAGDYTISVWCPGEAGGRVSRRDAAGIQVMRRRAADYSRIEGTDEHEHPDADSVNGLSGTETIRWDLRRP